MKEVTSDHSISKLIDCYKKFIPECDIKAFEMSAKEINRRLYRAYLYENSYAVPVIAFLCYNSPDYTNGSVRCVFNKDGFHDAQVYEPWDDGECVFFDYSHEPRATCTVYQLANLLTSRA